MGVFLESIETLAGGCASTGWVYGVFAELEWVIACLPEQGQIDVWGDDPEALTVGTIIPHNIATRTQGGWRFTGRQPFASGCQHAQWVIVGARCQDDSGREEGALWSWCRPRCVAEACRYPMRACCGLARPLR